MSALGDYVHLYFSNYYENKQSPYGYSDTMIKDINEDALYANWWNQRVMSLQPSNEKDFKSALEELNKRLKQGISTTAKSESTSLGKTQINDNRNEIEQRVMDEIYRYMAQTLADLNEDSQYLEKLIKKTSGKSTGRFLNQETGKGETQAYSVINGTIHSQWYPYLKEVQKRGNELDITTYRKNLIEEAKKAQQSFKEKYQKILSNCGKISNNINIKEILDCIKEYDSQFPEEIKQEIQKRINNNLPLPTPDEIIQILVDLRDIKTYFQFQGDFGEKVVLSCDDAIQELIDTQQKDVQKVVLETIRKGQSGNEKSPIYIEKASFVNNTIINAWNRKGNGSTEKYWQIAPGQGTKNKKDITITINGFQLPISVKAYSSLPNQSLQKVHLQDVNLLVTLAFMNNQISNLENFGNHWLNLHCATAIFNIGERLDEILSAEMLLEAFSIGNPFKKNQHNATVLTVLDITKGTIKIYNIIDILKDFMQGKQILTIDLIKTIKNLQIKNEYADTIETRLANILNAVHSQKINLSLKIT